MNKFNLYLVRTSQYLLLFNLVIKYKLEKLNVVQDAFSRLKSKSILEDTTKVLDALYTTIEKEETTSIVAAEVETSAFYITLVEISQFFK